MNFDLESAAAEAPVGAAVVVVVGRREGTDLHETVDADTIDHADPDERVDPGDLGESADRPADAVASAVVDVAAVF